MKSSLLLLSAILILLAPPLRAQTTSGELLFTLQSAAKTHSVYGMGQCFYLKGADAESVKTIQQAVEQIASWPEPYLFTTERKGSGNLETTRNGKPYLLNGDWTFQVHIYRGPPPNKGFVFPAGLTPSGKCLILVSVEKGT